MNLNNRPCMRPLSDWGLDPMFWTPAKLFIGDLHAALPSESASAFFIGNQHVFRSAELVGVLVSVDTRSSKMTTYHVDDGTGVILCVCFASPDEECSQLPYQNYDLGTTVCIEGRLTTYRDERQVVVRAMKPVDPDREVLGWLERLSLRKFLATAPF
ncbi:hypothetical protein H4R20_001691 [Coemansia guatemalensis]|uniref:CST complex subunit STN1 n=1 Tax=Coemansia guatemalensis TaxID=2761395 RepID=A0A9W8HWW1_9FUNG|nr:hypothetical protein H4R20_001691 [Coemansia guatemalensis]